MKKKTIKPPSGAQYRKMEIALALAFCPDIYPCNKCGWPVMLGYCCPTCHDVNPRSGTE